MHLLDPCGGRIILVPREEQWVPGQNMPVIIDPLPETHLAHYCRPCKVGFTTLKGGPQTDA